MHVLLCNKGYRSNTELLICILELLWNFSLSINMQLGILGAVVLPNKQAASVPAYSSISFFMHTNKMNLCSAFAPGSQSGSQQLKGLSPQE
jgi:hypothetical protein